MLEQMIEIFHSFMAHLLNGADGRLRIGGIDGNAFLGSNSISVGKSLTEFGRLPVSPQAMQTRLGLCA